MARQDVWGILIRGTVRQRLILAVGALVGVLAIVGVSSVVGFGPWATPSLSPAPAATTASVRSVVESPSKPVDERLLTDADRPYGCPSTPCPRSLEYAVEGCTCAGEVYESWNNDAVYCCPEGFSDEVCAGSLDTVATLDAHFGVTEEEVKANLVEAELQGWPVLIHWKMADALERVNERLKDVDYTINEQIDGYFWSEVPGTGVMSLHAYGIALDINPSTNPSCGANADCRCYNDLITDMPPEFVEAFEAEGFEWGGRWEDHPDPMHFEWIGWQ